MGEYQGKISGVGNKDTRYNEITADDLATLRYYQIGWDYGVVNRQGYKFDISYQLGTSSVEVSKGIMFAYGYVGYVDSCKLEFIRPAIPQYHIIYVELDRSKIPNTCTLKVKNNQSSTSIERTFRQDYLDKVRTGVFQLPIWAIKFGSNGIESVEDLRPLQDKSKQVYYTPNCKSVFGSISPTATATTQPTTDISDKIATTEFVQKKTGAIIDNKIVEVTIGGELSDSGVIAKYEMYTAYKFAEGDIINYKGELAEVGEYVDDYGYYEVYVKSGGLIEAQTGNTIKVTVE